MEFLGSVIEGGTARFSLAFKDTTGAAVAPKTATYTVKDTLGNVIATGAVSPLASTSNLILSGTALAIPNPEDLERILLVEAVYDSTDGADLPLKKTIKFRIQDI